MKNVDWHVHSSFSDGADPVEKLLQRADELQLQSIAITDHYDPSDDTLLNHAARPEDVLRHFAHIRELAKGYSFEVFCGIETCTDEDGKLPVEETVLSACDIVITSPHFIQHAGGLGPGDWMDSSYWVAYKRKLLAMAAGPGDVLGHPEVYLPFKHLLPPGTTFEDRLAMSLKIADAYFDATYISQLAEALNSTGKAYELHGMGSSPRQWVIESLNAAGVSFSIGSDAHTAKHLGCNQRAWRLANELGLRIKCPLAKRT